jgi:hypothetical protein
MWHRTDLKEHLPNEQKERKNVLGLSACGGVGLGTPIPEL